MKLTEGETKGKVFIKYSLVPHIERKKELARRTAERRRLKKLIGKNKIVQAELF